MWAIRRARIRRDNWWGCGAHQPWGSCVPFSLAGHDRHERGAQGAFPSALWPGGRTITASCRYRYPMEFAQHVLLFWSAVGAIYAFDLLP